MPEIGMGNTGTWDRPTHRHGIGGMTPGVGALWDLADAITYAGEGDWSGFFDSLLFAIPGAGTPPRPRGCSRKARTSTAG